MKRDFKGVWIPKEVLEQGLNSIIQWVRAEYELNLLAEKPLQEESK